MFLIQSRSERNPLGEVADDVCARRRARRDDDVVRIQRQHLSRARRPPQSQVYSVLGERHGEMIDDSCAFTASLDFCGEPQLATGLRTALDQDDFMSLPRGDLGGLHAGWAGTDHHYPPAKGGLPQGAGAQFLFVAGRWVVHARRVGDIEKPVYTTLVAADAAANLVQ